MWLWLRLKVGYNLYLIQQMKGLHCVGAHALVLHARRCMMLQSASVRMCMHMHAAVHRGANPGHPSHCGGGANPGSLAYIGGWGDLQPGNPFGSCASVIPRLGFFSSLVLRLRLRLLLRLRALPLPNAIPMQNQKC